MKNIYYALFVLFFISCFDDYEKLEVQYIYDTVYVYEDFPIYDAIAIYDTVKVYDSIKVYTEEFVYVERDTRVPKDYDYFDVSFYAAHALGQIDGYDYTNCKEAFEQSYAVGYRVFEVDVELTSDGIPVCMHDIVSFNQMTGYGGDNVLMYDDFLNRKIYGKYTPCTVDFIIEMLIKYDDIYIDLDVVYDAPISLNYIVNNPLLDGLNTTQRVKLLDRLIIELYFIDELDEILDIYNFKSIAVNSVFWDEDRIGQIDYLIENNLDIFVEHYSNLDSAIVKLYNDNGINVVAWTVDDSDMADSLSKWGVKNIYTNTLY